MPKYVIHYTTEDWWTLEVEAESADKAYDLFMSGEYTHDDAKCTESGFIQDSVEIMEA
jgi:hypothetical protein